MPRKNKPSTGILTTSLDGQWALHGTTPDGQPIETAARVPGVVHWDLERAGLIPDPTKGGAEDEVQWVALHDWTYRRAFTMDATAVAARHVELVFEGLDTIAEISLNGRPLARTENMFVPHRFDVKKLLHEGENTLEITFCSPVEEGLRLHRRHESVRLYEGADNPRAYLRKAQYSFGWDWGPKITTSGIWRSAYVEAWSGARILHPYWRVTRAEPGYARVRVSFECASSSYVAAEARLSREGKYYTAELEKEKHEGRVVFEGTAEIDDPCLWWPAGQGESPLYDAEIRIFSDEEAVDSSVTKIGLRTVELKREKDEEGESFVFVVNGREVFCKGANWIPADIYLPRLSEGDYDEWVRMAAEAGMNMLRVWGGGIYEDEAFYRSCDRRGVMVWQDFPYACAMYPEDKWFIDNARREAEAAVLMLRNHPSIVLWCGNNENHWAAHSWWPEDPFGGETLYDKVLPRIVKRLDPQRDYWPGSPFGGKDPNSQAQGDRHAWDAWSGWKDFRLYLEDKGRFVSEFGWQGCPEMETVAEFGPLDQLHPQHPLFERHNKMIEGTERLFRFLAGHFRMTTDLEEFAYLTQVLQGEAIKAGVLHWRSRMMKTSGALYWQLNDCWPVISWAAADYRRRPKALYYYTKRFFAPVAVRAAILADGVSAWVINDSPAQIEGEMVLHVLNPDGSEAGCIREHVEVASNGVHRAGPFKLEIFQVEDRSRQFVVATLAQPDGTVARDVAFFNRPKHMRLDDPGIDWECYGEDGRLLVTVSAKSLAYAVCLRLPGTQALFSDNFFTLLPGESIDIEITGSGLSASQASRKLDVRWVKGGLP